jgi:lipopolysaccharide export LptBFGC system permease protein LptF
MPVRFSTTFLYTLYFILQDMSRTSLLLSTLLTAIILTGAAVSVVGIPIAYAQNQTAGTQEQQPAAQQEQQAQEFSANLTGDAEVPPVTTNATGSAEFDLNDDGDEMSYDLEAEDIEGVLFAHIHQGSDSENGPIVVTLFNASEPTEEVDGTLESGDFAAEDFEGPLQGQNMTDLVDAIESGQAYVNVHTEANPPGEIRGTIEVAPAAASDDGGEDDDEGNGDDDN